MIYLILYGLLIIFAVTDMFRPVSNKRAHSIMLFLIVVFTLFRGLRWDTGTDWDSYLELFERSSFFNIFSYDRYGTGIEMQEPGIVFFNAVFNSCLPYTIYLLVTNAFILWAYKFVVSYFLSKRRVFAFCFLVLSVAFFPVRQEIANAVLMLSLPALVNKDYKKLIILSILAISIHKSAIFIILFIIILNKIRTSAPIMIAVFFSALLIGVTVIQKMATSFAPIILALNVGSEHGLEYYTETVSDETTVSIISVFTSLLLICIGCYGRKSKLLNYSEEYNLFLNIMVAFFSFNLLFNSSGLTLLTRMTKYLFFADAFVLAYFANAHKDFKSKILKTKLPILVLTLIVGGLGINRFINQCHRYPELMFPYISVFNDSKRNETPVDFDFSMLLE